jgi:hypothetical protein
MIFIFWLLPSCLGFRYLIKSFGKNTLFGYIVYSGILEHMKSDEFYWNEFRFPIRTRPNKNVK